MNRKIFLMLYLQPQNLRALLNHQLNLFEIFYHEFGQYKLEEVVLNNLARKIQESFNIDSKTKHHLQYP